MPIHGKQKRSSEFRAGYISGERSGYRTAVDMGANFYTVQPVEKHGYHTTKFLVYVHSKSDEKLRLTHASRWLQLGLKFQGAMISREAMQCKQQAVMNNDHLLD
jgi:hypothetical protein